MYPNHITKTHNILCFELKLNQVSW
jgi:hypothetical protein